MPDDQIDEADDVERDYAEVPMREGLDLLAAYEAISCPAIRRRALVLVRTISLAQPVSD